MRLIISIFILTLSATTMASEKYICKFDKYANIGSLQLSNYSWRKQVMESAKGATNIIEQKNGKWILSLEMEGVPAFKLDACHFKKTGNLVSCEFSMLKGVTNYFYFNTKTLKYMFVLINADSSGNKILATYNSLSTQSEGGNCTLQK